jgi:membrane-associated phospholipid phosphatase
VRRAAWVVLIMALGAPGVARGQPEDPDQVYRVVLPVDVPIIAVTGVGALIPFALSSRIIHPSCPCAASSVNAFDRGAIGNHSDVADWISTATVVAAIGVPPLVDWFAVRRHRVWLDDAVVFAQTLGVNGAFVTLSKYTVQRPIPRAYTDPEVAASPSSYRSFYSGHTAFAFAPLATAAVTANLRYGLTWQPWLVTVVVGTSVAVERVVAGYHFPSDVLVGAAAGLVVGTAVPLLHARAPGLRLSVLRPAAGTGSVIALAGWF